MAYRMLYPPHQVSATGTEEGGTHGTNKLQKHSKSKTLGAHDVFCTCRRCIKLGAAPPMYCSVAVTSARQAARV